VEIGSTKISICEEVAMHRLQKDGGSNLAKLFMPPREWKRALWFFYDVPTPSAAHSHRIL
jgi:hypothetical protein